MKTEPNAGCCNLQLRSLHPAPVAIKLYFFYIASFRLMYKLQAIPNRSSCRDCYLQQVRRNSLEIRVPFRRESKGFLSSGLSMASKTKRSVQFSEEEDVHIINTSVPATPSARVLETVTYKNPQERVLLEKALPPSSIAQPNYEDILRRVSVVIQQHITKCESRYAKATPETMETGLFHFSKMKLFSEESFVSPQFCYYFVRSAVNHLGFCYSIRQIHMKFSIPTVHEVYAFIRDLFVKAHLSAECSIICLIYCERLMETAHVPLMAETWKPCLLCGLLLASKVWQDLRYDARRICESLLPHVSYLVLGTLRFLRSTHNSPSRISTDSSGYFVVR